MTAAQRALVLLACAGTLSPAIAAAQRGPRVSNARSIGLEANVAPSAGRICISAFDDRDGDGVRDAGEPPLAGRRFIILGGANVTMAQGSTDGAGEYCTGGLAPGRYSLREAGAAGAPGRPVTLSGTETARVAFSAR